MRCGGSYGRGILLLRSIDENNIDIVSELAYNKVADRVSVSRGVILFRETVITDNFSDLMTTEIEHAADKCR